jgi:hypothetical protein
MGTLQIMCLSEYSPLPFAGEGPGVRGRGSRIRSVLKCLLFFFDSFLMFQTFAAQDAHVLRREDTDLHAPPIDPQHLERRAVAEHDGLRRLSRQNEHSIGFRLDEASDILDDESHITGMPAQGSTAGSEPFDGFSETPIGSAVRTERT